jgi:hypothetical protein
MVECSRILVDVWAFVGLLFLRRLTTEFGDLQGL